LVGTDLKWSNFEGFGENIMRSSSPSSVLITGAREVGDTADTPSGTWPTAIGQMVTGSSEVWECVGQAGEEDSFEPVIDCAPTMLEKDCSQGGTIVLPKNETAHARYKLQGSPPGQFSVVIGSSISGSWDRIVFNASNQEARIKASSGDVGITIPANTAYRPLNYGSNIIKVQ
jgi:hypothetical protein